MKLLCRVLPGFFLFAAVLIVLLAGCTSKNQLVPTIQAGNSKFDIASLTITPPNTTLGKGVIVEAIVSNSGSAAGQYPVVLKIDDKESDSKNIDLQPSEKQIISFQYIPDKPGKLKIDVNGISGTLNVLKPAEFQVTSLNPFSGDTLVGTPTSVEAEIKNIGEADGTYTLILTLDDKQLVTKEIIISGGVTQRVALQYTPETAGSHTIEIGGNKKSIKVLKPAQVEASSLVITPALLFQGQEAKVQAIVKNTGEVKGTIPVKISVNGQESDAKMVTLEPGDSTGVSFSISRDLPGKYEIAIASQKSSLQICDSKKYHNKEFNYSFWYPGDWSISDKGSGEVLITNGAANIRVKTWKLYPGNSAETFTNDLIYEIKKNHPGLAASAADPYLVSSFAGFRQNYSYTDPAGKKMQGCVLSIVKNSYGFDIIQEVSDSEYKATNPLFSAFSMSFTPPVIAIDSYVDPKNGYSLKLATWWDARETGDPSHPLVISSPDVRGFTNIYIEDVGNDVTAKDYLDSIGQRRFSNWPAYVDRGPIEFSGGLKGYQFNVFHAYPGKSTYKMMMASVVKNGKVYTLYTDAPEGDYKKVTNATYDLVYNFSLIEPAPLGVSRQDSLFCSGGEIGTLDPALTEDAPDDIVGAIFSGLVKLGKDMKVIPDIAEKWEVSPDGKNYIFHLRENAQFHNGKPVTAADFKFSWGRALDPRTGSHKASTYLNDIVGAADVLAGKTSELSGVKIIDDHTLQVTIDGPKPYFLYKLAYVTAFVVDQANVGLGKSWIDQPNGTGPFKLKQWKKDELLILERNDNFYGDKAKLKNVIFRLFGGRSMTMYEKGEIDFTGVGSANLDRVLDTANPLNKELMTGQSIDIDLLGFNVNKAPFDDAKVRKAFGLALNMDKLIEISMKGRGERAGGLIPPGVPGFNSSLEPMEFDPVMARQLIAESKYRSVEGLPSITMYVDGSASPTIEAAVAMWQQNLGVRINIEAIQEHKEYMDRESKQEFTLFFTGWSADYLDPQNFLDVLFSTGSAENYFGYSNAGVDAALQKAAIEKDEASRLKMYQEIEKTILSDFPAVPFYCNARTYMLVKPYISGLKFYPIAINTWNEISVRAH
jgi:oligopeptide transport system substrate-binding protein